MPANEHDWAAAATGEYDVYRCIDYKPPTAALVAIEREFKDGKIADGTTRRVDVAYQYPPLPEHFYVIDGADWADFTISWTEIKGVPSKPMKIANILDAAMTRDFIEYGPAPKVEPLPTFTPKRAKPAMAGLMCEHDGKVGGIGFCADR